MPKSKRKFFKTIIQVEVLSEDEPYKFNYLNELYYDITDGHCSGDIEVISQEQLTPEEAAKALIAQRSDPDFFGLDKDGNVAPDSFEAEEIENERAS